MNNPKVDKMVDHILGIFKEKDAHPIVCEAMDKIFRPYLHWMQMAQEQCVEPALVRNSMISLISSMIMEASSRMGEAELDGTKKPREVWLGEFMLELRDELVAELEFHNLH